MGSSSGVFTVSRRRTQKGSFHVAAKPSRKMFPRRTLVPQHSPILPSSSTAMKNDVAKNEAIPPGTAAASSNTSCRPRKMRSVNCMRIISWNVNGFRAALGKGFLDWLSGCDADAVLLQETKVEPEQLAPAERDPAGFAGIWYWSKGRKGYSGTACLLKRTPQAHSFGLEDPRYRGEGRVIHLEYPDFHLFNIYFPNGQKDEERLAYKMGFYDAFLAQADALRAGGKPVVVGGDFNTAHTELDIKNAKANEKTSGFLPMYLAASLIYWVMATVLSALQNYFENQLNRQERDPK